MATPPVFPGGLDALGIESAAKAAGDGIAKSNLFAAQSTENDKAQAGLAVRMFAGMLNAIAKLPAGVIATADEIEKEAGPAMLELAAAGIADVFNVQLSPNDLGFRNGRVNTARAGELIGEAALAAVFANLSAGAATDPAQGEANARKTVQLVAAEEMGQFVSGFFKGVIEHYLMAIPEAGDVLLKLTGIDGQARAVFSDVFQVLMREPWQRQLNRTYRPARLPYRTLARLRAKHAIEEEDYREQMAQLGYSDAITAALVPEETEKLTVGDIKALFRSARWSADEVAAGLVDIGYTPERAELLTFAIVNDEIPSLASAGAREALGLFEDGDISEGELRGLLNGMHWSPGEIEAGITLALLRQQKSAQLPLAAAEDAYIHGDIALRDLRERFERRGYRDEDVGILERRAVRRRIEEEEREREREERELQQLERRPSLSTAERAFVAGLWDAAQLRAYYLDVGFAATSAELQLALAERRRAAALAREEERARRAAAQLVRRVSPGTLREGYIRGLVERDALRELLELLRYDPADVERYLAIADQLREERELLEQERADRRAPAPPKGPSVTDAEEGFFSGLWTLERLADYYQAAGFGPDAKGLLLGLAAREKDERERERAEDEERRRLGAIRRPSRSDQERALRAGLISEAELLAEYARLGYPPVDAQLLLELARPAPEVGPGEGGA